MVSMWTKTVLISVIYRKSLVVTAESKKVYTSGEIVNLMCYECGRAEDQ